jgi:hypothetical protein
MRSDLIYMAAANVPNRFLLCQMVALWSRKAHQQGLVTGTINSGLQRIAGGQVALGDVPRHEAESQQVTNDETSHRVA